MKNEIFRKKSMDKVKSPESLDDYIRVSNPGVWLILVSVIVLLAGACVWGIFGHVDSTVPAVVHVENGTAVCYVDEVNIEQVNVGSVVRFEKEEAVIKEVGELWTLGYCCTLSEEISAPDGYYEGKVVTRSVKPLSFILN